MAIAGMRSEEENRIREARIERLIAEARRFCEAQHALATIEAKRLDTWLGLLQVLTVASLGAGCATLLIALASAVPTCH